MCVPARRRLALASSYLIRIVDECELWVRAEFLASGSRLYRVWAASRAVKD